MPRGEIARRNEEKSKCGKRKWETEGRPGGSGGEFGFNLEIRKSGFGGAWLRLF
jgi:hypothetical protein